MVCKSAVLISTGQENNWDDKVDPKIALDIMQKCCELCPELTNGKGVRGLEVIGHNVGFRTREEKGYQTRNRAGGSRCHCT